MGRLRELLDELQARKATATAIADARATDEWLSEGGAASPDPAPPITPVASTERVSMYTQNVRPNQR